MKRSKIDVINATVESYLKRRRYQTNDGFRRIDKNKLITGEEMTFNDLAETKTSTKNSIIFSSVTNDIAAANQAYDRLTNWVNSLTNDDIKQQLKCILYPVFCHLYFYILHAGNLQAALEFFKSHQSEFVSDTEKRFLKELSNISSIQDIELRPLASAFRSRKYKVNMCDEAYVGLDKYLSEHGHVIIMQILNIHVAVVRKIVDPIDESEIYNNLRWGAAGLNGHTEQISGIGIDREMRELQESIRLLKNCAFKPLRMFKLNNSVESASCARITWEIDKIAVGFNSKDIRLWAVGDTVLMKPMLKTEPDLVVQKIPIDQSYEENMEMEAEGSIILKGHTDVVHDLRFIRNYNVLLSVSSDNTMRSWRLNDSTCSAVYKGHSYPIWCMDTSLFDLHIVTGSHDRTAKLWSLDRKFPLRIFAGHFMDVNSIKFHPNSRYVASGSADKSLRLWNKDDGKLLRSYVGAQSTIYTLAFSPDGRYLASAGEDTNIMIWDLAADALLDELKGHQSTVMQLDWSSDGQFIISGSIDGVVRIWSSKAFLNVGGGSSSIISDMDIPPVHEYSTNCSSVLSLQFNHKTNLPMCVVSA